MTPTNTVWVVDDERSIRWVLDKALSKEGMDVHCFEDGESLLSQMKSTIPNVIVSDIRMQGLDGLELLRQIRTEHPDLPVIIMTAHSDLDSAVSSIQGGAFEYIPKPFEIDETVAVVKRALLHQKDIRQTEKTNQETVETEIIGKAAAMQEVFRAIGRLSKSNVTVLINGQSGTGKELVALALHRHSPRENHPGPNGSTVHRRPPIRCLQTSLVTLQRDDDCEPGATWFTVEFYDSLVLVNY